MALNTNALTHTYIHRHTYSYMCAHKKTLAQQVRKFQSTFVDKPEAAIFRCLQNFS